MAQPPAHAGAAEKLDMPFVPFPAGCSGATAGLAVNARLGDPPRTYDPTMNLGSVTRRAPVR